MGSAPAKTEPTAGDAVGAYFQALADAGLIDVYTGSKESLARELSAAEDILRGGDPKSAATALYAIVESPRYDGFEDFAAYQNAVYDLARALDEAGAERAALTYLSRLMARGQESMYFGPAYHRAIDIAIETRAYAAVLDALDDANIDDLALPEGAFGERAYLRARLAYEAGKLAPAEAALSKVSRKSRMYSSAIYLRALIRVQRGDYRGAATLLCEIAYPPSESEIAFVVDGRYFKLMDLARLALGRIAHETATYDDAYYHYFQVPDDSIRLSEALFESAWSMYQARELTEARRLITSFLTTFPTSPLAPEAHLLAGYIELADCQFDDAKRAFDRVITEVEPLIATLEDIRRHPARRDGLLATAAHRWRVRKSGDGAPQRQAAKGAEAKIAALLRIDPRMVRLRDATAGLGHAAADAPYVVSQWRRLAQRVQKDNVGAIAQDTGGGDPAATLIADVDHLGEAIARARRAALRAKEEGTMAAGDAQAELARLAALATRARDLEGKARAAATATGDADIARAPAAISRMIAADLSRARKLEDTAKKTRQRLSHRARALADGALSDLAGKLAEVIDKARLGAIDAVIGQKRRLEIEVKDLAAGRFPPELSGKMWERGLIDDSEEYWPFEGDYWADEYEDWR